MKRQPFENKTLHFVMSHLEKEVELTLHTGDFKYRLQPHTAATRAEHKKRNRALALMTEDQLQHITHFVEDARLPADVTRMLQVTYPLENAPLPALVDFFTYIPGAQRRANRTAGLAKLRQRIPNCLKFRRQGSIQLDLAGHSDSELLDLWADSDLIADSPLDIARSLTFSHPQLASRDPNTAAIVMDDYIDTSNDLLAFAIEIQGYGPATEQPGGWATIEPAVDQNGEVLRWGPGYENEGHPEGTIVYQYNLNDEIAGTDTEGPAEPYALSVVNQSMQGSQNDERLQNELWSVFQGTPDERQAAEQTALRAKAAKAAGDQFKFTLNNRTPGYGLSVPQKSIRFKVDPQDPLKGTFKIDAKNGFLRTLAAYVQFLDSNGKPINDPVGWKDNFPSFPPFLRNDFESASVKYLKNVTAVNVILGIPMPTDPTVLDFPWPANAASCRLLFGGLGTRDWNGTVDPPGILVTGVMQYGIPTLFMLGGAAIKSTAWFKNFVSDIQNVVATLGVAFPIVGGGVATAAALGNTKSVLFGFAKAISGILVNAGLAKLSAYVITQLTLAQFVNAIPVVGFGFRMAQMAITAANLAATTIEVAISPATYRVEVKRQVHLRVTVAPDPLHGTASQPAVWPKVATHYVATVQYRNGTNYTVTGNLPEDPSRRADPVQIDFPELPAGDQLQVTFGVYSPTDWLAGNWTSSWVGAVAPAGSGGILDLDGQIQEQLVPLTSATQYLYDSKLVFDAAAQRHVWKKGAQPTAVVGNLNGGSTGHNLSQLVNITLNDKAYMLGYTWQASGQNLPFCGSDTPTEGQIYAFQNISTLANPEAALKFPSCGFSAQPYLVYDQFGPAPLFSLDGSFQAGLDQGKVTEPLRAAFATAHYPLPADATCEIVQASVRWYLKTGLGEPTYDLRREPDGRISVFSYPTPVVSPNNFYVDPRSGTYHLRRVVLDEKTPFDLNPGLSYGYFNEAHLDSIVIHPAGYAVGVSFLNSKIEIIQIPDEGSPDEDAEPASVVSGLGIRQGLMNGPRAIAVTADGRLLVLEGLNQRLQAFDLNGNPVACFYGGDLTPFAATFAEALDQGLVPLPLREIFATAGAPLSNHWWITDGQNQYDIRLEANGTTLNCQGNGADLSSEWRIHDGDTLRSYPVKAEGDRLVVQVEPPFDLALEDRRSLDSGVVTEEIVAIFAEHGISLSLQSEVEGNGLHVPASIQVDLDNGIISPELRAAYATREVLIGEEAILSDSVVVRVQTPGSRWVIDDTDATQSYRVVPNPNDAKQLLAEYLEPTLELYQPDPRVKVTYLDLAVEALGYLYVLSFTGEGKEVSDYHLDLYDPAGKWLSRTPDKNKNPNATGVNAGRLIVDMWRNMYTLNFEHFEGPGGRTEPSVSTWLPTTPE